MSLTIETPDDSVFIKKTVGIIERTTINKKIFLCPQCHKTVRNLVFLKFGRMKGLQSCMKCLFRKLGGKK